MDKIQSEADARAVAGSADDYDQGEDSDEGQESVGVDEAEERTKSRKRPSASISSEDDRREERRAANRKSAFDSRQRRKRLMESLQESLESLTKENQLLRRQNDSLRQELKDVTALYERSRSLSMAMPQGRAVNPLTAASTSLLSSQAGGLNPNLSAMLASLGGAGRTQWPAASTISSPLTSLSEPHFAPNDPTLALLRELSAVQPQRELGLDQLSRRQGLVVSEQVNKPESRD